VTDASTVPKWLREGDVVEVKIGTWTSSATGGADT
jgi:translation initiation factor IF-1